MNARAFENLININELFFSVIVPNIGGFHLDFGCGEGRGSILQARVCPNSTVVGYDNDRDKIQLANERLKSSNPGNIDFIDSLDEFNFGSFNCSFEADNSIFDSVSANFVFHENPDLFGKIYPFLKEKGKLLILDYNLKSISERDFYKRFCLDNERRIMKKEGFEQCYKKHTRFGIDDCVSLGGKAGLKTVDYTSSKKYFFWVGQK